MTAPKDIFLPPLNREIGSSHPINKVKAELTELLTSFGFSVAEGPEVETEEYNFDKLNIPATHPAREMHDTFYVNNKSQVLRTHTSPVQVRTMLASKPPIAVVSRPVRYTAKTMMPRIYQCFIKSKAYMLMKM